MRKIIFIKLLLPLFIFSYINSNAQQLVNTGTWSGYGTNYSTSAGCNTITSSVTNHNNATVTMSTDVMDCDATTYSQPNIYGGPSLVIWVDWDCYNTGNGWGELNFTFANPVDNPIIHIERLGGNNGDTSNSALLTIQNGLTLTELSSNKPEFEVTSTTILNTPNVDYSMSGSSSVCAVTAGYTSGGSVRINGTNITTVTFKWERQGPFGSGDEFEIAWTFPSQIGQAEITSNEPCEGDLLNLSENASNNINWQWSGPNGFTSTSQNPTITNSSLTNAGQYYVTTTDNYGCIGYDTIEVIINPNPTADAGIDQSICTGMSTTLSASGGVSYNWDNGLGAGQSHTVNPTNPTTYTVTVTDSNGCTDTDHVFINTGDLDFDTAYTNVSCYGGNDGAIDITPINGTLPIYFSWDNGETTEDLTNLTAGTYYLTIVDTLGCHAYGNITISQPPELIISSTTQDLSCFGDSDGSIDISISGGTGPYSFAWNNTTQTTEDINNLLANTYTVTATDAHSCTISLTSTIYEPPQLQSSTSPTDISCFGLSDGSIDLNVNGGTPPYSFNWSNSSHDQNIINIPEGSYDVVITDANGCTITDNDTIIQPTEIIITNTTTDIICHGGNDGSININVLGGVSPYQYDWSNGANSQNINNLTAGNYVVTVIDNNGCQGINAAQIIEPSQLFVSLPGDFIYCESNTSLTASVAGGISPYSLQWNTGDTTETIQYQTDYTDVYSVTVTDDHGCTASDNIEITIVDIDLEAFANKDTVCPGDPILTTTNIIGGIPPYTIYSNGQITSFPVIVYPNVYNNYILTVIDACGNTADAQIDIYTYPIPPLSFTADILQGCPPLTVNFNQHNYSVNFNYVWNFDDVDENNLSLDYNPTHIFNESGWYDITVQVTDSNGCKNQLTIEDMINVYPKPDAKFIVDPDVVSEIKSNIYFDNISIDNLFNFWMFDDGDSSILVSPYHDYPGAGIYYPKLVVENEYGCRDTAIKKIEIQQEFTLYVPTAFSPDNDDINDGFFAVGNGIDLDNFWIGVYDRWGELIWESNDLFEHWNGKVKKGNKTAKNDMYTWMVVCKDFKGNEHIKTGPVTIIR